MELSKQVVSLELSIRLKELGVEQESLFWWSKGYTEQQPWTVEYRTYTSSVGGKDVEYYSAFTVAELGELLPKYILSKYNVIYELKIIHSSVWRFYYGSDIFLTAGTDDTEADARAKMLIYLLEKGIIKSTR